MRKERKIKDNQKEMKLKNEIKERKIEKENWKEKKGESRKKIFLKMKRK